MKSKKIWLALAGAGICLAAALVWQMAVNQEKNIFAAQDPDAAVRTVGVVNPRPLAEEALITLPGRARAVTRATLFFRVSGPLARVHANPGDQVEKGALLLELDDRDFRRQVAVVESGLASAQATLMKLQNGARPEDIRIIETNVAAARSDLALAEKEFQRYEILLKNQAVSEQAHDRAKNQVQSLTARVAALEEQLVRDRGGARKEDILAARAAVAELSARLAIARDQLADTRLLAPFAGKVTTRIPDPHEMVAQGKPVMTLDDLSALEIPVDVPEIYVRQVLAAVRDSAATALFLTQKDRAYPARLSEYSTRADQAAGTYAFVFSVVPDPADSVFPGMTAEIRIAGPGAAGPAVTVPLACVQGISGTTGHVFVVDAATGILARREIHFQTLAGSDQVRVREGLSGSDLVVARGAAFVYDGQKVKTEAVQ